MKFSVIHIVFIPNVLMTTSKQSQLGDLCYVTHVPDGP